VFMAQWLALLESLGDSGQVGQRSGSWHVIALHRNTFHRNIKLDYAQQQAGQYTGHTCRGVHETRDASELLARSGYGQSQLKE
jgi:hypothetical protein